MTTADQELLELAAKAAGLDVEFMPLSGANIVSGLRCGLWKPLEDDGDRYRLARTLNMNIEFDTKSVGAKLPNGNWMWIGWGDGSSDGRHKTDADAILALAAEIGRLMP